ncbi:MAG: hypothetical protein WCQ23_06425 [Candidatus Methanomethylophilaceae archaeon]
MESLTVMLGKKQKSSPISVEDDVLCIDCRDCRAVPEIRSPDCIRCIVRCISQSGNAERIKLRTSRDLEISGPAAEILCELSFLDRTADNMNGHNKPRSCANCEYSCDRIFDIAWQGFPDPYFESARGKLMRFRAEDQMCSTCLQKTYRALDQAELGLKNIKKKAALTAARGR